MDALLVAVAALAATTAFLVSRARARSRAANLKVSGGRKALVTTLFGRR